ncbi:MAG: CofH family radical SAM protein [Candidatus Hydrogenedentes bacterium]|nr:CofH family radical SAM protein [Candidatus Hydrogenedentota bacterium]
MRQASLDLPCGPINPRKTLFTMETLRPHDVASPPISFDVALRYLRDFPLLELGKRAFAVKRARYGDQVTFVSNRHVNPTNLCVYSCRFCDYAAKNGDAHAYSLTEEEILQGLENPVVHEAHIVGGLWPKWGFERSLGLVRRIRAARPELFIKAFTAVEVAYFARMEKCTTREVLAAMMDAGVDLLPGGGAEVLSDRIHQELYKDKIGPQAWLDIHEKAHALGLPSNATLLFGHIETDEEIVAHLFKLRALQARTPGFQSFIPLAYQPGTTQLVAQLAAPERCLRVIAASRLILDNIPHVKAYWPTLQIETAVTALNFGADDLDGTLGKERIMQLAETGSPEKLSADFLRTMIRQAGQHPHQRDGAYRILEREVA